MSLDLREAIVALKMDEVVREVKTRTELGQNPIGILEECQQGMSIVGERFEKGDFFLAELILSGEIFKKASAILEPYLAKAGPTEQRGKVVMATVKGDIHDLGKNIVVTLLKAHGFEVHDLGVDVNPKVIVTKVKEIKPEFLGLSCLMTPALKVMKETADMLAAENLRECVKVMVGGGVTTPQVKEYVGADYQSIDAMGAVTYCRRVIKDRTR